MVDKYTLVFVCLLLVVSGDKRQPAVGMAGVKAMEEILLVTFFFSFLDAS